MTGVTVVANTPPPTLPVIPSGWTGTYPGYGGGYFGGNGNGNPIPTSVSVTITPVIVMPMGQGVPGERNWGRRRGDDPFYDLSAEALREIMNSRESTPAEKERARRIRKEKLKEEQ